MAKSKLAELSRRAREAQSEAIRLQRQVEREAEKTKGNVTRLTKAVSDRVYATGNSGYIEAYSEFIGALDRSSRTDVLPRRIRGLTSYLEAGHNYREEQKTADEQKGTTRLGKPAAEYLRNKDIEAGVKPISDGGYYSRIRTMESARHIRIEREPGKKKGGRIKFKDLDKVHKEYLPYGVRD